MSANKDYKPIIAELRNQGWTVDRTGQGHYRAAPPDRSRPIVHFSASDDFHALKNTVKDLAKSGFIWPPPSKKEQAVERKANGTARSPDDHIAELEAELGIDQAPTTHKHPAPEPETKEDRMDRLFHELKDAKTYLVLADEHLAECKRKLDEAQRSFADAETERNRAADALKSKKVEFDEAFSSAA